MPIPLFQDARAKGLTLVGHELRLVPWKQPTGKTVPVKTLEAIAACAALDLTYWCDHSTNMLWAADNNNRLHEVQIDRKLGTAVHYCGKNHRFNAAGDLIDTQPCGEQSRRTASWAKPPTSDDLWSMLGADTMPEPAPQLTKAEHREALYGDTGHCTFGRHKNCPYREGGSLVGGITMSDGSHYTCGCECHREEAKSERVKARGGRKPAKFALPPPPRKPKRSTTKVTINSMPDMTLEAAVVMINFDPDFLGMIPTDRLTEALGATPHDDKINTELAARGLTPIGAS